LMMRYMLSKKVYAENDALIGSAVNHRTQSSGASVGKIIPAVSAALTGKA